MQQNKEDKVRKYFLAGVIVKGVISLVEVVAGFFALFVPIATITDFVTRYGQAELVEDPGDFIATHLVQIAHGLSITGSSFIAFYLLSRGIIRLFLVIALLKNVLWAYPASLGVLGIFLLYQLYQISISFSPVVIALTIFDLVVMWLIWREYQELKPKI